MRHRVVGMETMMPTATRISGSEAQADAVGVSRRAFLRTSVSGGLVSLAGRSRGSERAAGRAQSVIQILLTGGPSQLETWDPKPAGPAEARGSLDAISTRLPGVYFSELFPRLAQRADRLAVLRTVGHDWPAIHETGLQLTQTGHWRAAGDVPHFGAAASWLSRERKNPMSWWLLPGPLGNTGVPLPQGQTSGSLGESFGPKIPRPTNALAPWGFEAWCDWGLECVRRGPSVVTINMFGGVFDQWSWDMHGSSRRLFVGMESYRRYLGPMLDRVLSRLLDRLASEGLWDDVLVMVGGEMGRSPRLNSAGGRDHWTRAWSMLLAGGGIRGGAVVGTTDAQGGEPTDRPIHPGEVVATIHHQLGWDRAGLRCLPFPRESLHLPEREPIYELI